MDNSNFKIEWQRYFDWLVNRVRCPAGKIPLLATLHEIPFHYRIKGDRNRVGDAIYMRVRYCEEYDVIFDVPDNEICEGSCSVLELLVSFASRIDTEYTGLESDSRPDILFWQFINNLGLGGQYIDGDKIEKAINGWINGDIDQNGYGGLFPLKKRHPGVNQSGVEMWSQMMPYINENF